VDPVEVVLRKYDGRPHRSVTGHRLGEDRYGVWLGTPAGTTVHYHYGTRPTGVTRADAVRLIPRDAWWIAMFTAEPSDRELYCDVCLPPHWTGPGEVTVVDLDIDLARYRSDGRVEVEDEDEFEEHRVSLGYPDSIVEGALRGAAELRVALSRDEEPFAEHYRKWLALV
jgi:protein associated with RNAse G/E